MFRAIIVRMRPVRAGRFPWIYSEGAQRIVSDSVAVDAKRILLRYGAPIAVLDQVTEVHRIEFAREIARTNLPDRGKRLKQLLAEHGYLKT